MNTRPPEGNDTRRPGRRRSAQGILVWLPSPLGDAVLATPALRMLRAAVTDRPITFVARPTVRALLSPERFNDAWVDLRGRGLPIDTIRRSDCREAILLKNSFGSALAVFAAGVPRRVGYARDARRWLLTDRVAVPRDHRGRPRPEPMIDYYLRLIERAGYTRVAGAASGGTTCARRTARTAAATKRTDDASAEGRRLELPLDPAADLSLAGKIPALGRPGCPVVVLVCGGAFGPSKCWPAPRFARLADRLTETYDATVVALVAPDPAEKAIAEQIAAAATRPLISTAQTPLTIAEVKALIAQADLVVANDTGPRHIAIALQRPVITLFGPNDPAWTQTGYPDEIQIVGRAPCAPCAKPHCRQDRHLCMEAISIEAVFNAASKILEGRQR